MARQDQRADRESVVIDGIPFPVLEIGLAFSDPDTACADAKRFIDLLRQRLGPKRFSAAA